ncbi:MAG: hypothetical protein U1F52_09965 [Burkholderiales bacterium]
MYESLVLLASSFWIGAVHAATPGHGKTIAAAYIVGARGRPVDAWILGIFVTLSHTSGIVLVGVVASLGLPGVVPQRIETWLEFATAVLVILIGLWTLWTQRELFPVAGWSSRRADGRVAYAAVAESGQGLIGTHSHGHGGHHHHGIGGHHHHHHGHEHDHAHGEEAGYHSHGWGFKHTHDVNIVSGDRRPSLWILVWLGVVGGLLPDPTALALLLRALAEGKVMLGLGMVLVFSVGFAAVLVGVGVVAAKVGQKILTWLAGPWAARLQIGTSLIIVLVGVVLTAMAVRKMMTSL